MSATATAYHALTKYARETLGSHPGLDWSNAPPQFKDVVGDHKVELRAHGRKPDATDLRSVLARFLYFANGITGHLVHPGGTQLLRAAPSAGALYPTEMYVAVGDEPGLDAGLYAYDAREEVLTRLWDDDPRPALGRACDAEDTFASARAVLVANAIFWRSAWRYQERGYRRVLLDTGHVLANLASIGPFDGLQAFPHLGFADDAINGEFFFEADREATLACIPLIPMEHAPGAPALWRSDVRATGPFEGDGHLPSEEALTGSATAALHRASSCNEPTPVERTTARPPMDDGAVPTPFDPDDDRIRTPRAIARRRSARTYPEDSIPFADLIATLSFTIPFFLPRETWDAGVLEAHLIAHRVDGLDAGIYRVQGDAEGLLPWKLGDVSAQAADVCLGQQIAATCAAMIVFTANGTRALDLYGERAYRYVHLEAGALGQRIQIAAADLEGQACGIGGFLDDEFATLLGLGADDWILYPVTIGAGV